MANGKKKKSKKKLFIFGGLALLLLVVVIVVVASGDKEVIVSVQTEKVEKRTITQVVSATGKINPVEQVVITPEVTGEIVELPVKEGMNVNKGQLLIRIKPDIYLAQRDRAQAQLESAKAQLKVREANLMQVRAEFERMKELYEKGLASDQELEISRSTYLQSEGQYESQKASVTQSEGSLREAQENLAKTAIYSPLNGTVSALNVELGERVLGSGFSQGTNIMTVAALDKMEATVDVDENDVVLVSTGDTARVKIDAFRDKEFLGVVTQIGNSAKTSGLGTQDEVVNFEVKIELVNSTLEIRPGMSCDADIETETRENVFSVPIQSVTARTIPPKEGEEPQTNGKQGPQEVVFLVDGSVAKIVAVKTGISDDTHIEITSGLEGEETIVTGSYRAISKELEDGTKVSIQGGGGPGMNSRGPRSE
ncbi:MAG: efflux RND transporter periplasmic adaptor subunit [Ignavibacteriales bacterium]|jgi:HlyD family secretion protein|nr:efflux RND transporter periplasmic adaptor subunit [Melioribacteraceae bacterium]RJP62188.1 MAG: efflux RND transporter periplasmic adaptor subunit [Ignavibacteriales bacterium]